MTYWLTLNRPQIDSGDNAVRQVIQRAVPIHMSLAETALAMFQPAAPQAQMAACAAIGQLFLQPGRH